MHSTMSLVSSLQANIKFILAHLKFTVYGCKQASYKLVSSPDQIFHARPADSSKNRVWTLSLWKLGQVYVWQAINWVIVGVDYIISNQQRLLWHQKIYKLAIYDDA